MEYLEKSIQVNVPVSVAYDQWTQFAELPLFMDGMNEVREPDTKRLYGSTAITGKTEHLGVCIIEQIPNYRIAWRSTAGTSNAGIVIFHSTDNSITQIVLKLSYEPDGVLEKAGAILGFVSRRVESDLQHFKAFIETQESVSRHWHDGARNAPTFENENAHYTIQ
ncbi:MAG: SRPBCC family protein [Gammaproteobacteria bacterium]